MDEYLANLKSKFNYSDELMTLISNLIPAMISYYGKEHENLILSALYNCEIHIQEEKENTKDILNNYFGVDKEREIPPLGGAFFQNEISVKDNKVMAKPIIYIKTVIFGVYKPFDFQNDKNVIVLVHEICHLIKGYGKLKIVDGKIVDSTGLLHDVYTYTPEKGVQEERTDYLGIEEAVNEVDATRIMEIMIGREQQIGGYKRAGDAAKHLLEHDDIAQVIKSSQFKDDDNWIQYLGEDAARLLIENFDTLVKLMYFPLSFFNDKEKYTEALNKLDSAEDVINDFAKNYCPPRSVESYNEAIVTADKKTVEMVQQLLQVQQANFVQTPISK